MKRLIILTLVPALLLGSLAGCGQVPKAVDVYDQPPALVITDPEGDTAAELDSMGYQWTYPAGNGRSMGVDADAIHPLDANILALDELHFYPEADAVYALSFDLAPSSVSLARWDAADIGDTQAEPLESTELTPPYETALQPGSVYLIHAVFDKDEGSGDADYCLITLSEDTEFREEDEMLLEKSEGFEESFYWQTEEYAQQMEAIRLSQELRGGMDAYYSRILPLLLSGEDNSVCSPLNLYLALSMLAETAGGESRAAILSALNAPDMETVRRNAALLWAANNYDMEGARCLLASSLWLNEDVPVHQAALDALRESHHAQAFSGVMGSEALDQQLRDWINEKTMDLLKEFTAGLKTQPETVMELVSTMYFKASWTAKFEKKLTDKAVFHGAKGDTRVDMMHRTDSVPYYYGDRFSAVSLALNESGSMFFILPDEGVALESVISDPQVAAMLRDRSGYPDQRHVMVEMSVPKFEVKSDTDLNAVMTAMGMGALFDADEADFSPLTEVTPVFLSQAEHAAGVSVDEEGVTGAAYTVFGLAMGAMPPSEIVPFVLDRPFMFVVAARDGSVLFAGTVTDIG